MTIAVLKGESQNNVLREFADQIAAGLVSLKKPCRLIDLTLQGGFEDLNSLISGGKLDGVFSFNAILGDVLPENFPIPFVGWLVDSPHYHLSRLKHTGGRRHYIFPSKDHINFIIQAKIIAKTSILLAGAKDLGHKFEELPERNHTIILAATWMGEPKEFWNDYAHLHDQRLAKKVVEILDEDQRVDAVLACNIAAKLMGVEFESENSLANLASLSQNYIRQKDRLKIVKTIAKSGLPFTLIGQGWNSNVSLGSNVNFIDNLDNKNISNYYAKSKIVVNINSSNGACERLFEAMSVGACVLSDYSDVLLTLFEDKKDFCLFDRRKPSSIIDALEYAMKDGRGDLMTTRSFKLINNNHLWSHRAKELSKIFDSFKFNPAR